MSPRPDTYLSTILKDTLITEKDLKNISKSFGNWIYVPYKDSIQIQLVESKEQEYKKSRTKINGYSRSALHLKMHSPNFITPVQLD